MSHANYANCRTLLANRARGRMPFGRRLTTGPTMNARYHNRNVAAKLRLRKPPFMNNPMRLTPLILLTLAAVASAQQVTTPQQHFGFNIGDEYRMASYTQLEAYWKKLAAERKRVKLADIGLTAEGRHQWMLIVSAPENLANLEHYRDISRRLAHAEGLTSE